VLEVPLPEPGFNEVRIKVAAAALNPADAAVWAGYLGSLGEGRHVGLGLQGGTADRHPGLAAGLPRRDVPRLRHEAADPRGREARVLRSATRLDGAGAAGRHSGRRTRLRDRLKPPDHLQGRDHRRLHSPRRRHRLRLRAGRHRPARRRIRRQLRQHLLGRRALRDRRRPRRGGRAGDPGADPQHQHQRPAHRRGPGPRRSRPCRRRPRHPGRPRDGRGDRDELGRHDRRENRQPAVDRARDGRDHAGERPRRARDTLRRRQPLRMGPGRRTRPHRQRAHRDQRRRRPAGHRA